jgi:non-ribosomal peptide synthase protein (TIGR01720 family)
MRSTERWYGFDEHDVWTLFHSAAFDFSVWEIWGALLYGGRIVVVPFLVSRSPEAFYDLLSEEHVTVLNQTPSAFRQLIQAEEAIGAKPLALRYVIFGGEALEMQSLKPWFDRHGDEKPLLVNMYGITETTVHVTYRPLSRDDVRAASVIGVPIPDLQIYILDAHRQPVPVGVPGEMYVGGAGLARGYLRRDALTAERFVPDTVTGRSDGRLYRTGDLARFLQGRDIEYLGRIDHQVKIRGFRIELGEIESVLCQHPGIREAVVVAREDVPGSKRLVGYAVTAGSAPDVGALRDHLKLKLPEYMVPAAFVFLEKLPLTGNGKVDRKALPAPEQQRPELSGRYVAPRNAVEQALADIWSKVLRVEHVGIHDNFFDLGGDSILSIQIISLARRNGLMLTPKLLFANQTIAELSVVAQTTGAALRTEDEPFNGEVHLTPIQRWFFEQNLEEAHQYNQAFLFAVSERLERPTLERALVEVGRHHDALRLRFAQENGEWRQFYSAPVSEAPLGWIEIGHVAEREQRESIETFAASAGANLDFESGPVWRVLYFDLGAGTPGRLLLVVHHLAVDGISWRPLLEDLETAYQQIKAGEPVTLPQKTTSFRVWADRLRGYAASQTLNDEVPYWTSVGAFDAGARDTAWAKADTISGNTEASSRTVTAALTAAETQALLQDVPAAYNTQINDVLLTAMARAWRQATGGAEFFTNLEGHGRENLFDDVDLSRTVGWFTSIFPVCLTLPASGEAWAPGDALKSIKEQLRSVPKRGVGFGILRYLSRNPEIARIPEPSIVFNYLGQFDRVLADSRLFVFAPESTGPWHSPSQVRRHALEINSVVVAGRLDVTWTYAESVQSEGTIQRFADAFIGALRELILHCVLPTSRGRTSSDFPLARLDQPAIDRLVAGSRDVEDIYPLSPIQRLFYSASPGPRLEAIDQWHCTLNGNVDVPVFQRAWRETLRRHTILRSSIHDEGASGLLQVVHRDVDPSWTVEDWRGRSTADGTAEWNAFLRSDRLVPLDLTNAPIMRFALRQVAPDQWRFLWSVPALLLDGWSWPLVFHDVSASYAALCAGDAVDLEPVRPYRDYVAWLDGRSDNAAQEFWRDNLAGFDAPTLLPADAPEAPVGDPYAKHVTPLAAAASSALSAAARSLRITTSSLVQAAWAVVLSRESRATDVVFGAAFAGRPTELPGSESIVGPFVNTLPVRTNVRGDATVQEFLEGFHAHVLAMSPHQFTPLMEIQRQSAVPWRHRLFETVVVFQNYLVDESARRIGGQIEIADFDGPVHTNYPIMLLVEPGDDLRLTLIYDQRRVARQAVERCAAGLGLLLQDFPGSLDKPISELQDRLPAPGVAPQRHVGRQKLGQESQNFLPPQTDMERTIATVWQRMFGMEQVGVEENFFDLGGHSLLLVQLHEQLRQVLRNDFSIVTLFEHPTVRSLARHFDAPAVADTDAGAQWRERAERQKQALSQLKNKLKRERK